MSAEIYLSCGSLRQVLEVPLSIKPVTYQSVVVCLFLQSLLALQVWDPVLDYTCEAPEEVVIQKMLIVEETIHVWG